MKNPLPIGKRLWAAGISILVLLSLLIWWFGLGTKDPRFYFYDWQPSLEIGAAEKRLLLEKASGAIFLKFGSFEAVGESLGFRREVVQKTLRSYEGLRITGCYRIEFSLADRFGREDPAVLAKYLASKIQKDISDLSGPGAEISGVHLDFDCPSSLLSRYADLLKDLRRELPLPSSSEFSVTTLPNWMLSPLGFLKILKNVDFHVPLFFGYGIGKDLKDLGPIGGSFHLRRYLFLAGLYGKKFYVGLPTYSVVMVYDGNGKLLSLESDLPVADLLRCPELRQVAGGLDSPFGGTRMEFIVTSPLRVADRALKAGWRVVSQEMDAQALRAKTDLVRKNGPSSCGGFLFYRMDKEGGALGMTPPGVIRAAGTGSFEQAFGTDILSLRDEGEKVSFKVVLWNDSDFPTRSLKAPAFLQVRWKNGQLLEAAPGDFSNQAWSHGFERQTSSSSMERSNCLRLMCRRLEPGSKFVSGTLRVRKLDEDFALYLFADIPVSTGEDRVLRHDYEVFPRHVEPSVEIEALK